MTEPSINLLIYTGSESLASPRQYQRPIVILIYVPKQMTVHATLEIWKPSNNVLLTDPR